MLEPVVVWVHEIVVWNKQTVGEVILEAKNWIIHDDTVLQISVTFTTCEEVKIFNFMTFIVGRALLSGQDVIEVFWFFFLADFFKEFGDDSIGVKLRSVAE